METSFGRLEVKLIDKGVRKITKGLFVVAYEHDTKFYLGEVLLDSKYCDDVNMRQTIGMLAQSSATFEDFAMHMKNLAKEWQGVISIRYNFE